ncbi:hypothetical protein D8674_025604 [Pyrus ussuriensis x Pyrus communis]|uniref:Uncharacterized protein n=1 Tax=Pyrus ussuriensis x Pyrus communis TaxID=2448454 RepID=A0A5N5IBG5_9ROSA|nr:hypothetical protein D8674_025604 [Pyrus ussuriensis x Pyrus communis]
MESSAAPSLSGTASSNSPSKRLLFDRRYGWVIDELKDPSEEALAGGRGMFCILPLAKTLIKMASQSINAAANSAVKAFERPDLLSPQQLQAGLYNELHKIKSSLVKPEFNTGIQSRTTLSQSI